MFWFGIIVLIILILAAMNFPPIDKACAEPIVFPEGHPMTWKSGDILRTKFGTEEQRTQRYRFVGMDFDEDSVRVIINGKILDFQAEVLELV